MLYLHGMATFFLINGTGHVLVVTGSRTTDPYLLDIDA
jgi:hypothetical protein